MVRRREEGQLLIKPSNLFWRHPLKKTHDSYARRPDCDREDLSCEGESRFVSRCATGKSCQRLNQFLNRERGVLETSEHHVIETGM